MSIHPSQLFLSLTEASKRARREIASLNASAKERTERLKRLADQNTDAFVDLSEHYLPRLSRASLPSVWKEVRGKIGDILLEKEDRRRSISMRLADNQTAHAALVTKRELAQKELDDAKLILSCKAGNFKKMLREDPAIVASNDAIDQIDEEIECALVELDRAESDADSKLPAYESCNLFQYLRRQKYGTPEYAGNRLERHWDRWVAKLTGFPKANRSYGYLTEMPEHLGKLISKKQTRYQELLTELEEARRIEHSFFRSDCESS